jgi:hypothetical protein
MDDLERAASGEHEIAGGREDIGSHEAHPWECKASLDLSASAAFVASSSPHRLHSSPHLPRIGCIRLLSSSSPHRLHSAPLLIFSASAAFVSSPHLLRILCTRLVSSSSPAALGVSGPLQGMRILLSKSGLEWSGVAN